MNVSTVLNNYSKGVCSILNPFDPITKYFNEDNIINSLNTIVNDVIGTITKMPRVTTIPGIKSIHTTVTLISYSCASCLVCYKGVKMLFSPNEADNKEGRTLLERTTYSVIFSTMSLKFIDIMIEFANTLINVLMKTSITTAETLVPTMQSSGLLVAILLLLLELFISMKILITFWMRMAELVFSGVVSPVVFVLWINKEWAGFLKGWWKRVAVLVFTQVAQVLLLVIYGKMLNGLLIVGTFNSLCLSIAMLFLVDSTPKVVSSFMDSNNTVTNATAKFKRRRTNVGRAREIVNKFTRK